MGPGWLTLTDGDSVGELCESSADLDLALHSVHQVQKGDQECEEDTSLLWKIQWWPEGASLETCQELPVRKLYFICFFSSRRWGGSGLRLETIQSIGTVGI